MIANTVLDNKYKVTKMKLVKFLLIDYLQLILKMNGLSVKPFSIQTHNQPMVFLFKVKSNHFYCSKMFIGYNPLAPHNPVQKWACLV